LNRPPKKLARGRNTGDLRKVALIRHVNGAVQVFRWGGRWDEIEGKARPLVKFENNLLDQDLLFVDAAKLDFQLRDDSPAWKVGFQRIPVAQIGLVATPDRASPPTAGPPSR